MSTSTTGLAIQRLRQVAALLKIQISEEHENPYYVLSQTSSESWLLAIANYVLRKKGQAPVEKIDGFTVLDLDEYFRQQDICSRCSYERVPMCPFQWYRVHFLSYKGKMVADRMLCAQKYRQILVREILELSEVLDMSFDEDTLKVKEIRELVELRDKLREKARAKRKG